MKIPVSIFILLTGQITYAQSNDTSTGNPVFAYRTSNSHKSQFVGQYSNFSGGRIEIKNDSTFKYSWRSDMSYSSSTGTWSVQNDTIFFDLKLIYDTIGTKPNPISVIINRPPPHGYYPKNMDLGSPAVGQVINVNYFHKPPEKLFYKRSKLFPVVNYKAYPKKVRRAINKNQKRPIYWYRTPNPDLTV